MINFKNIVIGVLLILLLLTQTCKKTVICPETKTTIKHDTTWIVKDTVIYSKPKLINTIKYQTIVKTQVDSFKIQDTSISCMDINIYSDTIKLDTSGVVIITDTVQNNKITGRASEPKYKFPVITNTITNYIVEPKKTQWYVGVDISGNQFDPFTQIGTGFLIKNKKDGIFGAKVNLDIKGNLTYGVQKYWKITLR